MTINVKKKSPVSEAEQFRIDRDLLADWAKRGLESRAIRVATINDQSCILLGDGSGIDRVVRHGDWLTWDGKNIHAASGVTFEKRFEVL